MNSLPICWRIIILIITIKAFELILINFGDMNTSILVTPTAIFSNNFVITIIKVKIYTKIVNINKFIVIIKRN
jgi:hypothetical protein